jgi:hypothetical protein
MTAKYIVQIYRRDAWEHRCCYKTCHEDLTLSIQWLQTYLKWVVYSFAPHSRIYVQSGSSYTSMPVHEVDACMRALVPTRAEVGFDVDADHAFWYGTIKQTTDGPILYAHPIEPPPPPAPVLRRSEARISIEPPRVRVCREPILNRPDDSYIVVVESAAWSDAMRAIQSYAATAAADYAYIPHTGDTEVVKTREFAEYMESKSNLLLCTPAFGIYCGQYKYTVRCTPTASQQPI